MLASIAYLLDTNIVSDLIRHPHGSARVRLEAAGVDSVVTSVVVACELRFGLRKRNSARLTRQAEAVMAALEILPLPVDASEAYGRVRHALERLGTPIGPNDLLIAAHALALDLTLVTDNVGEFKRVKGLRVENWLA